MCMQPDSSQTFTGLSMYMHRRGTGPIAVYKATNCSPHSYLNKSDL